MPFDFMITCATLASLVLGAVLFLLEGRRAGFVKYERVEKQGGSALLSKVFLEIGYSWLEGPGEYCVRKKIPANAISLASFGCGLLAGLFVGLGLFGVAGLFLGLSGYFDALDGFVARKSGAEKQGGAMLDSCLDRYVDYAFLAGVLYFYRSSEAMLLICLLAMHGSFMVSYTTAKAESISVVLPRGSMKRSDRIAYLLLGSFGSSVTMFLLNQSDETLRTMPMTLVLFLIAFASNISAVKRIRALVSE